MMRRAPFDTQSPLGLVSPFGRLSGGAGGGGGGGPSVLAAQYNGTTDGAYFNASPPLSGVANGPAFTMSMHWKATKSGSSQYFTDQDIAFFFQMDASGTGFLRWLDTADGSPLPTQAAGSNLDDGNIHSIVMSADRITGRRQIIIDRVTIKNDTGYATAVNLDLATEFYLACRGFGASGLDHFGGFIWELWWDDSTQDVVTNLDKFVNPDGTAADKGADGSIPTGSAPAIYAPDGLPTTNLGTGGNATAIGSPTVVARPTS